MSAVTAAFLEIFKAMGKVHQEGDGLFSWLSSSFQALLDYSTFISCLKSLYTQLIFFHRTVGRTKHEQCCYIFSPSIFPVYRCLSMVCLIWRHWQVINFLPWTVANFVYKKHFCPTYFDCWHENERDLYNYSLRWESIYEDVGEGLPRLHP